MLGYELGTQHSNVRVGTVITQEYHDEAVLLNKSS